jgi:hypothetical protein
VYPDDRLGWESAVGVYEEEFFTDATLNPGVSVVTDNGYVKTSTGVWWDRLVCSPTTTTTWQFATPLVGFGGNWNPGGPGGSGAGIAVAIDGSWVSVGEISRSYTGQFWGFVSTVPFSAVRLSPGSGSGWCETYELDNMVYAADPWADINKELDELIEEVEATTMPNIIKQRLIGKLEYAKALKDNAKEECEAGNFDGATKKLGVAKSQVQSFESMVKITRRISPEDKASFLEKSAEIKWKIDTLIEYIETEHKC